MISFGRRRILCSGKINRKYIYAVICLLIVFILGSCEGYGYELQYSIETFENDLESIQLLYIENDGSQESVREIAYLTQDEVQDVIQELPQLEIIGLKGPSHSYESFAFKLIYPEKYIIISLNYIQVCDSNGNYIPEESHFLMYSEELDLLLKKYGDIYEPYSS